MTITHPQHPLRGHRVAIIRIRQGVDPDLVVRLPDGSHAAIAMSSTDYAGHPDRPTRSTGPLLDLDGLRQLARLLAVISPEARRTPKKSALGTTDPPRDDREWDPPVVPPLSMEEIPPCPHQRVP